MLDFLNGIDPVQSGIKSEAYAACIQKEMAPRKEIKYDP